METTRLLTEKADWAMQNVAALEKEGGIHTFAYIVENQSSASEETVAKEVCISVTEVGVIRIWSELPQSRISIECQILVHNENV